MGSQDIIIQYRVVIFSLWCCSTSENGNGNEKEKRKSLWWDGENNNSLWWDGGEVGRWRIEKSSDKGQKGKKAIKKKQKKKKTVGWRCRRV